MCGGAATARTPIGGPDTGASPPPPLTAAFAPTDASSPPASDRTPPEAAPSSRATQAPDTAHGIRTADSSPDVLAGPNPGSDLLAGPPPDDIRPSTPASDPGPGTEVVTLVQARVADTAQLEAADTRVSLFGIEGFTGEPARQMQDFLATEGDLVTCRPRSAAGFVCRTPDGSDVAQMALVNGAARVTAEAPDSYREQEQAAQAARRGIWATLPPPPDTLVHPVVRDTATLLANDRAYGLDGIVGLGGDYASQLQDYIAAHGDTLTCSPQGGSDRWACVLPDGTDVAMVALANGAARVTQDSPDAYWQQQADAINNRRGYWLSVADSVRIVAPPPPDPAPYPYGLPPGDDGVDGIRYVAGAPVAVIDTAPVFLVFAAGLGWGYYDHFHHWRPAPEPYRIHMERFHPEARGLPGYRNSAWRPGFGPGPAGSGPPRHAGPPEAWAHPRPAGAPPGWHLLPGGWVHAVAPGAGPVFHGGAPGAGVHPGASGPAPASHANPSASNFHSAPMRRPEPPGSGFRTGLTGPGTWSHAGQGGGFHPGAPPAMHPSPPVTHAASPMSHGSPSSGRRLDETHRR
ncbi:hypothetical protein CCS01_31360, partial [Rhodopila globiformis]